MYFFFYYSTIYSNIPNAFTYTVSLVIQISVECIEMKISVTVDVLFFASARSRQSVGQLFVPPLSFPGEIQFSPGRSTRILDPRRQVRALIRRVTRPVALVDFVHRLDSRPESRCFSLESLFQEITQSGRYRGFSHAWETERNLPNVRWSRDKLPV